MQKPIDGNGSPFKASTVTRSRQPISWLLPVRRDGEDDDPGFFFAIHHGERETPYLGPSRTGGTGRTTAWKPEDQGERGVHRLPKTLARSLPLLLVVPRLV